MELKQSVAQKQKLSLTPRMRQSLEYLQVSLIELDEMLREEALSNPLLIVRSPSFEGAPPVRRRESSALRSQAAWDRSGQEMDPLDRYVRDATFQEHLEEQLGQFPGLDREMLWICRYLVGCLDERGYLDCALEELEEEIHIPYERLEQALFVIQMLDPPGVGGAQPVGVSDAAAGSGRPFRRTDAAHHPERAGEPGQGGPPRPLQAFLGGAWSGGRRLRHDPVPVTHPIQGVPGPGAGPLCGARRPDIPPGGKADGRAGPRRHAPGGDRPGVCRWAGRSL